jgi:predicted tellurium resistance membrane protein TerC
LASLLDPALWLALAKIIGVNVLLSGDNAVVIALAARSLSPRQQKQAIFWGSAAAIVCLILLTAFAVALLEVKYLKIVAAVLLLWIGVKLLLPESDDEEIEAADNLGSAIKTMLMVVGLCVSIPLVIFGATLLLKLMERWPIIITIGAGLLGFVAGEMAWEEPAIHGFTQPLGEAGHYVFAFACAIGVIAIGRILGGRTLEKAAEERREDLESVEHPQKTPAEKNPAR